MAQPPDDYELLRQRMPNLPDISIDNPEPVFHNVEADVIYNTGGSVKLASPILQKYWADFLSTGRFGSWYGAAGWFQALSDGERKLEGKWLGFEHLDLRDYPALDPTQVSSEIMLTAQSVLATEEQERLRDLAYQFDLLIGDPQNEEDFEFWRRYLQDKVTIYRDHRASLALLSISRAGQLASALEFLAAPATGSPAQQAQRLAGRLIEEPPGSFWVDEPFLEVLFQVIADRSDDDPRRTARLLLNSPFTLEDMVLAQPAATATIFRSDFAPASALVRGSDSLLALPWWIMYRLIKADPALGAQLSAEFHRRGETKLVAESLGYLVYDKDR